MAARRLVALLIALLVISSIATALAPPRDGGDGSDSTSTTTPAPEPSEDGAGDRPTLVEAEIDAGAAREGDRIEAEVGDRLALSVKSDQTAAIEIPGLGLYETAAPGAPATFYLVLREEGTLEVTADGRRATEILVGTKPSAAAGQDGAGEAEPDPPKARKRPESGSSVAA